MPSLDMPVAAMFDDLKRRADRGDARASCRLAVELINCNQLESLAQVGYMQNSESAEKALTESGLLMAANSVATQQIRQLESAKRCDGISEDQRKLAGRLSSPGSERGHPGGHDPLRRRPKLHGMGIRCLACFRTRDSTNGAVTQSRYWKRHLRHGEPAAVFVLYVANSDNNSPIGGLIADDPVKAYSYRLLMNRLRGKATLPRSKLSSRQIEEAVQNATRMHAEYFDNRILRTRRI